MALTSVACAAENDPIPTADVSPPSWEAASLQFPSVTANAVVMAWSAATDNVGVVAYQVFQDDVLIASPASPSLSLQVTQLGEGTTIRFRVEAADAAGNVSTTGPSATVDLGDETPPFWTAGSVLSASDEGPQSVTLAWSGADDNIAVTGYRVYQQNVEVAATDAATTTYTAAGLVHGTTYIFRIEAHDAHGNASTDGPTLTHQTGDDSKPGVARRRRVDGLRHHRGHAVVGVGQRP